MVGRSKRKPLSQREAQKLKALCQDSSEMHPTADLRKGDEYGGTYSCVKGYKEISQSGTVQFCASGVFWTSEAFCRLGLIIF